MKRTIMFIVVMILASASALAANQNVTQENVTTILEIYDLPVVSNVLLEDSDDSTVDELDPVPASNFTVTCNATISDADGEDDIVGVNATIYLQSVGSGAADDVETHYTNSTCDINKTFGNGNEALATCTTEVRFYAEPGMWECNLTAIDTQNLVDSGLDTSTMTQLLALDVTDGEIDFGALAVGNDTGSSDFPKTITNNGNINLSLKLNTWGATLGDASSMNCTSGITEPGDLRVATGSSTAYNLRTPLSSTNDDGTLLAGFNITKQTTGSVGTTSELYFGMGVSASGNPVGNCNGNIMFTGTSS